MDVSTALHSELSGDGSLTALLATYKSAAAIFTSWPVPADAARPYVVSAGNVSDTHADELSGTLGRDFVRDVTIVDDAANGNAVETIAEAVRAALHRKRLTITGARARRVICIGGSVAPTDPTLVGRILSFRIVAMET